MDFGGKARLELLVEDALERGLSEVSFTYRGGDNREVVELALAEILENCGRNSTVTPLHVSLIEGGGVPRVQAFNPDGEIRRDDGVVVVRRLGTPSLLQIEGVVCENATAPPSERIYRKEFRNKKVYLPGELAEARASVLEGPGTIVLGMTGYSAIGAQLGEWGITDEAYVAACSDLIGSAIKELRRAFPGVAVKLVDGASYLGVDQAVIDVARALEIEHLGFSCPNFMFYVRDDSDSVYVAPSQADYGDAFVQSLDILYSVGGRVQALQHDIDAALHYRKRLMPVDLLGAIAPYGSLPAWDKAGNIVDATKAFMQSILQVLAGRDGSLDRYRQLKEGVLARTCESARCILEPNVAYSQWRV